MSNNEWFERGELPPVGIKCKVDSNKCESRFVKQFHNKEVDVLMHMTDHVGDKIAIFSMPDLSDKTCLRFHGMVAGSFRPIKTERERAIDAAREVLKLDEIPWADRFGMLYDAGCLKVPE